MILKNIIKYAIFGFILWQNFHAYMIMKENKKNVHVLSNELSDILYVKKVLNERIYLMQKSDIDLIEMKAMWTLGYSPKDSKILLH